MHVNFILFFFLTLLAEILGTIGGFGSSLLFVSIGQFFFDFPTVLALTGLLHIFSNVAKLWFFRKTIDKKLSLWLGVSSVVFAIVGALLTQWVELRYAKIILGIFLLFVSVVYLAKPTFQIQANAKNAITGGSVAGFLAGFIGTGGAIRGLVLTAFNLEKNLFVGTSAAIDFGVDISRTILYLEFDFLPKEMIWYIPLLMIAAWVGSYLGKKILVYIHQETFKKIVLVFTGIIGLVLLINEITK